MSWSKDYKKSIDCDNPKGFSQKAHCDARKKRKRGEKTQSKPPFSEMREHCGCEDIAVEELESKLKKINNTSYDSIDRLMRRIIKNHNMTAKQLHNAFVNKHNKTPDDWIRAINEDLRFWFGKGAEGGVGGGGWDRYNSKGKRIGKCARENQNEPKPKCLSRKKASQLRSQGGVKAIANAVRRKRKNDPVSNRLEKGGKPIMVSNKIQEESKPTNPALWSKAKSKARSKFDVYPSAYANGWAAKWYKSHGGGWKSVSEETNMIRYCPKCKKDESRDECKYGVKYWDIYSMPIKLGNYTPNTPHPGNFPEESYNPKNMDHEYSMARSELSTIISAAKRLRKRLKGEGNIEAWVQSKITKASDYIDTAADYVDSGEMKEGLSFEIGGKKTTGMGGMSPQEIDRLKQGNPGAAELIDKKYQQIRQGINLPLSRKNTRMDVQVAHYEPENDLVEFSNWREDFGLSEDWQKINRKDKTDGLSQKAVNEYRREHPGSKLQTAVTEKKPKGKRAKRRASFCRRMKGMRSKLTSEKTARDPDSRINKALRRWNCN